MSIRPDNAAPDGFVLHSFAGDDPIKCKDYVRERLGLPAFKPNGNGHHRPSNDVIERAVMAAAEAQSSYKHKKIVATYDYTDAEGKLLYQVVRYEPKDFRQRRPDGNGGWTWKLDERRVPYRWPELVQFPDAPVFFCEGEKDADNVAALNLCATTIASGKWTEESAAALAGRDVIIFEDNDGGKGRNRALEAAQALHGKANSIRVVLLPDVKDVSDWLAADPKPGATELAEVCFAVPEWTLTTETKDDAKSTKPGAPSAPLESQRASAYSMRAVRWFWPDRFALGKLGLIGGLPDKGKGLISADVIARCTTGGEWPCNEGQALHGNVIWFTAEDDIADTVIPRLTAAGADLDRVHIIGMAKNSDGSSRMFNLATDLLLLLHKIEEVGDVVLVIIDPMSAYLGVGKVNNSSTTDVRGVLAPLTKLAEDKNIAIVGIMHFNKKADVTNAMLRIADSLAYVAAARHVYVVVDDAENDKARLFVKAKNNLAPDKHALRFMVGTRMVGHDPETKEEIWAPHVVWDNKHVEVTATEAMEAAEGGGAGRATAREAEEFLKTKLAHGPVLKQEIEEEAKAMDISVTGALKRAKLKLGIKTYKEKGKLNGHWLWELPATTRQHHDP